MTSPRRVPIFDGHNDVLLRLYRRGGTNAPLAFLEGEGKGQLDSPRFLKLPALRKGRVKRRQRVDDIGYAFRLPRAGRKLSQDRTNASQTGKYIKAT
jgi:hypothetical protein